MADRACAMKRSRWCGTHAVTEILDVKADKVTGVRLQNLAGAKRAAVRAGVFVAIGRVPNAIVQGRDRHG